jgi:hypothetical protein
MRSDSIPGPALRPTTKERIIMPQCPSEAQSQASRENGALASGPRDTSRTRFNATKHGFTAALGPPTDPDEALFYHRLVDRLCTRYGPQDDFDFMLAEEIASLELRRTKVQHALLDAPICADEEAMRTTMLLMRYETDVMRKLQRRWERLEQLDLRRHQSEFDRQVYRWNEEVWRQMQHPPGVKAKCDFGRWELTVEDQRALERMLGPEAVKRYREFGPDAIADKVEDFLERMRPRMVAYLGSERRADNWMIWERGQARSGSFSQVQAGMRPVMAPEVAEEAEGAVEERREAIAEPVPEPSVTA